MVFSKPFAERYRPAAQMDGAIEGRVRPQLMMRRLPELFPPNALFLADTGCSFVWATHDLHPPGIGRYRSEMRFGAMGWAIGAAIGIAMANRKRSVSPATAAC